MTLIERLRQKGETLSAAESLTGGEIMSRVVSIPGASQVFFGGVVSYTDDIKHRILSVSEESLARYTAVSAPVAEEMARGVAEKFGTSYGISATGLAGPGGGTPEIPVGRVYIGLYHRGQVRSFCLNLTGDRQEIRKKSADFALSVLEKELTN